MKRMIFCILLMSVTFSSCRMEEMETIKTNNNNFDVQLLFEKDGCKVYRFWDLRWRYFTSCNGSVEYTTTGKHPEDIRIQTVIKK